MTTDQQCREAFNLWMQAPYGPDSSRAKCIVTMEPATAAFAGFCAAYPVIDEAMVERAARALYTKGLGIGTGQMPWERLHPYDADRYRDKATAALEAAVQEEG